MVYTYVHLNISNPESLAQYREKAAIAISKHGGKLVHSGGSPSLVEGTLAAPDTAAIVSFPDKQAVENWINDPELQSIHDLRRNAGDCSVILIA